MYSSITSLAGHRDIRSMGISILVLLTPLLTACGGGGGGSTSYTIGGTVSGVLGGGLVLQNNSGNDLVITADGSFTFSSAVANGARMPFPS